jgi:hypothetical protein
MIYVKEKPCDSRYMLQPGEGSRAVGAEVRERDYDYFVRRAAQERVAAARATHPAARQTHLQLAQRYEEVAAACDADPGMSATLNLAAAGG